ncbi:glycosyl transferase, group 1 [Treponema pallidum subsp. pallidum str. Chicago]|nr:glycosyl transferase, group 1 [Treponema pallidum subsp. pallidum str. Chicago]
MARADVLRCAVRAAFYQFGFWGCVLGCLPCVLPRFLRGQLLWARGLRKGVKFWGKFAHECRRTAGCGVPCLERP